LNKKYRYNTETREKAYHAKTMWSEMKEIMAESRYPFEAEQAADAPPAKPLNATFITAQYMLDRVSQPLEKDEGYVYYYTSHAAISKKYDVEMPGDKSSRILPSVIARAALDIPAIVEALQRNHGIIIKQMINAHDFRALCKARRHLVKASAKSQSSFVFDSLALLIHNITLKRHVASEEEWEEVICNAYANSGIDIRGRYTHTPREFLKEVCHLRQEDIVELLHHMQAGVYCDAEVFGPIAAIPDLYRYQVDTTELYNFLGAVLKHANYPDTATGRYNLLQDILSKRFVNDKVIIRVIRGMRTGYANGIPGDCLMQEVFRYARKAIEEAKISDEESEDD